MKPNSLRVLANGLEHHVLEWTPELVAGAAAGATVFLIHGFMDAAAMARAEQRAQVTRERLEVLARDPGEDRRHTT